MRLRRQLGERDAHGGAVNGRAVRRVDAERQLRAWGEKFGVQVSILRAPGIYAADRLPLERIKRGTPALIAADDSYTNHIHATIWRGWRGRPCFVPLAAHLSCGRRAPAENGRLVRQLCRRI